MRKPGERRAECAQELWSVGRDPCHQTLAAIRVHNWGMIKPNGLTCNQPGCGCASCLESGGLFGDDLGQLCFYDGSPASSQTLPVNPLTIRRTSDGISNHFSNHIPMRSSLLTPNYFRVRPSNEFGR